MSTAISNGHASADPKDLAWPAFPCHYIADGQCSCGRPDCSSPGKHPYESIVPHGCKDATKDHTIIAEWWRRCPKANVAVSTDELVVVDIDPKHGGLDSLRELEGEYGETLPRTVKVETGGGGYHYYLQKPDGVEIRCRNGWRPGIDIKAVGGYVVAPPSNHKNGQYRWAKGRAPHEIAVAPVPGWLLPLLPQKQRNEAPPINRHNHATHSPDRLQRAQAYVAKASAAGEGMRNDAAYRLAGHVASFGLSEAETYTLLLPWNMRCNPPLEESELRQCVKSAFVNGTPRPPKEDRPGMPDWRPAEYRDNQPSEPRKEITYQRITSAELDSGDFSIEYAIEGAMVYGQPLEIGGPMKSLKTSIMADAAISLASGGHFLGMFKVTREYPTLVMSGESGMGSIQEIARRVCRAAGKNLADLRNLFWSPDVPKFNSFDHLDALDKFITTDGIEILFCDPAYLAMPSADAGNIMAQGELLRNVTEVCNGRGVSLVLCHHTKRNTGQDPYEPLELQHLAWAGHAEFARQWWLVNRRERYEPGTGDHRLWLSIGGSAGHSSLWAVDVSEGTLSDPGGRRWEVTLTDAAGARDAAEERKRQAKQAGSEARIESDRKGICEAMASLPDQTETKSNIRAAAGLNGSRFDPAFASLLRDKIIIPTTITKGNGQAYDAFKLA